MYRARPAGPEPRVHAVGGSSMEHDLVTSRESFPHAHEKPFTEVLSYVSHACVFPSPIRFDAQRNPFHVLSSISV